MTPLAEFLKQFDSFVVAREELRRSPEGSESEQDAIKRCADQWRLVLDARDAVRD